MYAPEQDYVIFNTYTNSGAGASLKNIPWDINAASFTLHDITFMPFTKVMDNGWHLSVHIPENEIFAEIESQNNRFSMIIAFLSVIMLCLAYAVISKLINAPIKRLTSDVA